jgi:hypothetical protein
MNRRQFLSQFVAGGALLTAGCTTIGETPEPFNFAIVNRRERPYTVAFTLWDDDEVLLDGVVDIAARPPGDDEYTTLQFDDLARVTNGDTIDVRVEVDGETFEGTYEVTCNESKTAENDLFFRIRHPDAATASETGMEISGSKCYCSSITVGGLSAIRYLRSTTNPTWK